MPPGRSGPTIDVPRRAAESGRTLVPGDHVLEIGHSLTGTMLSSPLSF